MVARALPAAELDDRLFRTHFENLPGPAFIWRRDGGDFRLLAHNRAGARIAEDRSGSHVGRLASELYPDRPDILADLRVCAERGEVVHREAVFQFRKGAAAELVVTVVPLAPDLVVAHVEDVTQQRMAARAVEQSEARMRALFASNPDVVFRMDADARFLDMHVPEVNYFPWTREQLIGRTVADFYGEEAHQEQVRRNRKAISTGSLEVFQYRLAVGDAVMNLESRVARSGDDEVVVSVRDVSDRAELERKLTVLGERERNRIGREIHDGLAQMLTGVKLLLENLEKRLAEERSRYARDASQATELVNNTISQARARARLEPDSRGDHVAAGARVARNAVFEVPRRELPNVAELSAHAPRRGGHRAPLSNRAGGDHQRRAARQGHRHRPFLHVQRVLARAARGRQRGRARAARRRRRRARVEDHELSRARDRRRSHDREP
jgi:PAS domain S-box-containing protein